MQKAISVRKRKIWYLTDWLYCY